jgi:tetratricopeptide (TPR) repeat protein
VRDSGSWQVLESTTAPVKAVEVTADPCFRLPNASLTTTELLAKYGIKADGHILGIQLRHWNHDTQNLKTDPNKWESEVAQALDTFVARKGVSVVFIPFQQSADWAFSDDRPVLQRVRSQMQHSEKTYLLEGDLKPGEISSIIAGCDLVLAMRFHSVILSVKNAVPCVALAYSLKVKTAMESSGLGQFALGLDDLEAGRLSDALKRCYADREKIRHNLKIVSDRMSRLALKNTEMAVELLKNNHVFSPLTGRFNEIAPELLARQTKLLVDNEAELAQHNNERYIFNELIRTLIYEGQRYDVLEKTLRTLLEIKPNDPEWNYLFAFCLHIQNKNYDEVLKHYNIALEQGFSEFWVRYNRGNLYLNMGNIKKARADIERAFQLDPVHPGVRELKQRIKM